MESTQSLGKKSTQEVKPSLIREGFGSRTGSDEEREVGETKEGAREVGERSEEEKGWEKERRNRGKKGGGRKEGEITREERRLEKGRTK